MRQECRSSYGYSLTNSIASSLGCTNSNSNVRAKPSFSVKEARSQRTSPRWNRTGWWRRTSSRGRKRWSNAQLQPHHRNLFPGNRFIRRRHIRAELLLSLLPNQLVVHGMATTSCDTCGEGGQLALHILSVPEKSAGLSAPNDQRCFASHQDISARTRQLAHHKQTWGEGN